MPSVLTLTGELWRSCERCIRSHSPAGCAPLRPASLFALPWSSRRLPAVTAWFRTSCDAACAAFNLCHDGMLFGMAKILVINPSGKILCVFSEFFEKSHKIMRLHSSNYQTIRHWTRWRVMRSASSMHWIRITK